MNWSQNEHWGWNSGEINDLKRMYPSTAYSFQGICDFLSRSRGSIASKANALGLKRPDERIRIQEKTMNFARKLWTKSDDTLLRLHRKNRLSYSAIAKNMHRPVDSIKNRIAAISRVRTEKEFRLIWHDKAKAMGLPTTGIII